MNEYIVIGQNKEPLTDGETGKIVFYSEEEYETAFQVAKLLGGVIVKKSEYKDE